MTPNQMRRAVAKTSSSGSGEAGRSSSSLWMNLPSPTEMTVITASAPNVPVKTRDLGCLRARRRAMKKVLSPISLKKINRKPERRPSRKGSSPTRPGMKAAPGVDNCKKSVAACEMDGVAAASDSAKIAASAGLVRVLLSNVLLVLLLLLVMTVAVGGGAVERSSVKDLERGFEEHCKKNVSFRRLDDMMVVL